MEDSSQIWPLLPSALAFLIAAVAIGAGGVLLTVRAERLALVTDMGQLLTGAVLIGAATSLSGLVVSVSAAHAGHASLAVSNSLGGIAAQTVFLAVADIVYRRANLEHAAASESNLLQATVLIALLALPLLGIAQPDMAVFGVHPVSVVLIAAYIFGLRIIGQGRRQPMWQPRLTRETQREASHGAPGERLRFSDWRDFALLAALVAGSGWVLSKAAVSLSVHAGMSQTLTGGIFTAITTSLPELVVAVAAVRRGALALAVGDILGGNAFDVLFLAASDIAYIGGSIYVAVTSADAFWAALSILLASVVLLGLIRREKHGIANIGFESMLVFVIYVLGVLALAVPAMGQ